MHCHSLQHSCLASVCFVCLLPTPPPFPPSPHDWSCRVGRTCTFFVVYVPLITQPTSSVVLYLFGVCGFFSPAVLTSCNMILILYPFGVCIIFYPTILLSCTMILIQLCLIDLRSFWLLIIFWKFFFCRDQPTVPPQSRGARTHLELCVRPVPIMDGRFRGDSCAQTRFVSHHVIVSYLIVPSYHRIISSYHIIV